MNDGLNAGDEAKAATAAPRVTIILTNYNHARYLECSLGAIVGQTHPANEIIVIDDGSTDNSIEVLGRYAHRHPNLRILRNERNRGVQYSIARAIGAATSDWIVWAAADDRLLPDFLKRSVEMICLYPDVGVIFSQLATFDDQTGEERHYNDPLNTHSAFYFGPAPIALHPEAMMKRLEASYLWLSGNTAVVRRDCLLDVGAFIPGLEWHSDWFAFYAVALRYGVCVIPETLAAMRVVPNTYSSTGMNDPKRQARVMANLLDVLRRPEFSDIRARIRARPCILSPFPQPMLRALLKRPRDWDIGLRLTAWALNHRRIQYASRLAHIPRSRGWKTRLLHKAAAWGTSLADRLTPSDWKYGPS